MFLFSLELLKINSANYLHYKIFFVNCPKIHKIDLLFRLVYLYILKYLKQWLLSEKILYGPKYASLFSHETLNGKLQRKGFGALYHKHKKQTFGFR